MTTKCHYCDNPADRTVIWLKDKQGRPAEIALPWCGCDLMVAIRKRIRNPYTVQEGVDYQVKFDESIIQRHKRRVDEMRARHRKELEELDEELKKQQKTCSHKFERVEALFYALGETAPGKRCTECGEKRHL